MKIFTTLFFMTIICFACKQSIENSQLNIPTEEINFSKFKEMTEEGIPKHLVKSVQYIKLKNKSQNRFNKIDAIKIKGNRIFILDSRLRSLVVFDMHGDFIGKVGKRGKDSKEYLQISDFDVNKDGNIFIIDGQSDKINSYDSNFKFLYSLKLPFEADVLKCLPEEKYMFGLSSWNKGDNSESKIVITDKKMKPLYSYFQYDKYIDHTYWISNYALINSSEDSIMYNRPIDNSVYVFSLNGEPTKRYLFDFGKMNVPDEDKKDIEKNRTKFNNYKLLKDFTIINNKYIIGTILDRNKSKTFIIDRANNELYFGKPNSSFDSSNLADFYGKNIVSYLYPGMSDHLGSDILPTDVIEHLNSDNYVVCIHELK